MLHSTCAGIEGEKCVLILFGLAGILLAEGFGDVASDSLAFSLPVPPGIIYTTKEINVIPQDCATVSVTFTSSDNCTFTSNISGCNMRMFARNGSNFCSVVPGSVLTSTAPVLVYININSTKLQVLPINQLGESYLFSRFYQDTNEICEQLFIYPAIDLTTLDICSDDFPQTNMSNLLDREVINESSRQCFKKTISEGDGFVFNDFSSLSRLQINSDRPVGILYGLTSATVGNKSCSVTEEEEGLVVWQSLPPVTAMGKLFAIAPGVRHSNIHLIITGMNYTVLTIQTKQMKTSYDLTPRDPISVQFTTNNIIIVEANTSVLVQVNQTVRNWTALYFAQPLHIFLNSCSEETEKPCTEENQSANTISGDTNSNLIIVCAGSNVTVLSGDRELTPTKTLSYSVFDNRPLYILNYTLLPYEQYLTVISISKFFILTQIKWPVFDGLQKEHMDKNFRSHTFNSAMGVSVFNSNSHVIKLKSALDNLQHFTDYEIELTSGNKTHVFELDLDSFKSLTMNSSTVQVTQRTKSEPLTQEHYQNSREDFRFNDTKSPADDILNNSEYITDSLASKSSQNKQNQRSVMRQTTEDIPKTKAEKTKFTMQMQNPLEDVNKEFKIVVDLIQKSGKVTNVVEKQDSNNPPYLIDSDMFFAVESDLDRKSSLAVIISLSAALSAVLLVILVFFLVEVFSRRKYIRNTRIRPSISFY